MPKATGKKILQKVAHNSVKIFLGISVFVLTIAICVVPFLWCITNWDKLGGIAVLVWVMVVLSTTIAYLEAVLPEDS